MGFDNNLFKNTNPFFENFPGSPQSPLQGMQSAPPSGRTPMPPQQHYAQSYAPQPPQNYESLLQEMVQQMQAQQEQIAELWRLQQEQMTKQDGLPLLFPNQYRMGVIKYPYLIPRLGAWIVELVEPQDNSPFATTANTIASGTLDFSQEYTFLTRIHFWLYRTTAPDQSDLPVGCFLPLSCRRAPLIAAGQQYIGKDFLFRVTGSTERYTWQSGTDWRASWDVDETDGFLFDTEYQTVPKDTIRIEAIPLTAPVQDDVYHLIAVMHGYKMEPPRAGTFSFAGQKPIMQR